MDFYKRGWFHKSPGASFLKCLWWELRLGCRNGGDRKATTKKLCDKDFAKRSGELSGALALRSNNPIAPSNCSENSLALFVRFFGFVGPFKMEV